MKKLAVLMVAIVSLLSGCVVYDSPRRDIGEHRWDHREGGQYRGDRDRDRDRDGVPDRQDRRPYDPYRY